MAGQPWYGEGLRFECTGCGDCCSGAPGYVWVNQQEIDALAKLVGMTPAEFEDTYVRRVGIRRSLIEYANGDCVFLDGETRACTVYDARPRQCRTWPFWSSNLRDEQNWRHTCQACPGCGQGDLVTLEEIERQAAVIKI